MKKLLLLVTAVFALMGCKKDEPVPENEETISVSPESKEFDNNGGTVSVKVTSTGEWTLSTKESAKYDWVSTDKTNGVNGDEVKFTVVPNETEEVKFAYYVFTCGKKTAEFKITSFAGEVQASSISVDEKEIVKGYEQGQFGVVVKYSEGVDFNGLKAVIPAEASWLKHVQTLDNEEEEGIATMYFDYEQLDGLEAREVAFTISYEKESIPMKMKQNPKAVIEPEKELYELQKEEGVLSVKVTSNITYNAEVITPEGTENWLTDYSLSDGVNSWKYTAFDGRREATIKFTEASPAEGAEPVVATVKVIQAGSLISTVARMDNLRAVFSPDAANKSVLNLGKNFTLEILVNPDEAGFNACAAIIGLDRRFIIRHSDSGRGVWEVVYARNYMDWYEHEEVKVEGGDLTAGKWTHLAVTVDGNDIKLYQDGFMIKTEELHYDMKDVDFSEVYTSTDTRKQQEFAIGYGYNNDRFFEGQVAEARIWNRALTLQEIKAPNHFYYVNESSEGLVAYWKINEGSGSVIKDYTLNGNNLVGQKLEDKTWTDTDLVWESVTLPE